MRVAMVTSGADTVANFRGTLIRELVARGVTVDALAPDWSDHERAKARALGANPVDISMRRAGLNPLRDAVDTLRLVGTLRRLKPDVTLTYFVKPNTFGNVAAWLARVARRVALVEGLGFLFDSSATPTTGSRIRAALGKLLYRAALATVAKVLFLNRDDEAFFADNRLVAPAKRINIGAIGVDLAEFPAVPPVADPVTFVMMSRLLRGKGVLEYAEAAASVRARHPAARFLLLGDVDANPDSLTREELRPWVETGAIDWPGRVDDVRERLGAASVFVLPAWCREGMPRSTQEAAAMGKPVITTDVVGCRDTVSDGVNGFMVPARDVPALAAAMTRFVEEPALIARMGAESRRIAERDYDGRRISARIADILLDGC